jgi:predicted GIY-YIG superfamily endonuclease
MKAKEPRKPPGHWLDYDRVRLEAQKYTDTSSFYKACHGAYNTAKRYGWFESITQHMVRLGNYDNRMIYCFEFPDNHVYVGLTANIKKREREHFNENTSVSKHIIQTSLVPTLKIMSDYIAIDQAIALEISLVNKYRDDGWLVLNKIKAGGIGNVKEKWTFERVKNEALKFNTKFAFEKGCGGAYGKAIRKGWINQVCMHMKPLLTTWTHELCLAEALKYTSRSQFRDKKIGAYLYAHRNGIINDVCAHMKTNHQSLA